jgi:hypothetical protein
MAKRRIERAVNVESPWDWLLMHSERDQRERGAYVQAYELDKVGQYADADEALRVAGIREEVIQDRRRHIGWRLRQEFPALSS